jgi:putative ABC transport system permease protein
MIDALYKDIQFGLRRLLKNPLFTLAAAVPMVLGLGVNTAMFTVGNALLRKPLAIPDIGRLVAIVETSPEKKGATSSVTPADYLDLQRQSHSFERIVAYQYENRVLTRGDSQVSVVTASVSPEFFSVFGASPQMGRTLTGSVNEEAHTVVLSYAFWRDRMGAGPAVGHTIELDSQSYTVVGVMPKGFSFPVGVDVWLRLAIAPKTANNRTAHRLRLAGKLQPGITLAESNAELEAIAGRLAADYADTNKGRGIRALHLSEIITGRMTGQYVIFLLGGVLFVLAMACSNVANLLLARGATRQNEMAVRQALGASRIRMVSLLLTESTLIAIIGAGLSLPLAALALDLIRGNMPVGIVKYIPGFESIEMDYTALVAALIMAALSGALAGITPALRVTRCDVNEVLKAGGRSGTASRANTRLRSVLLIGEVALAMALLVGTVLMVKGVHSLSTVNPGSAPANLLTMWIDLPVSGYSDAASWEHIHSRLLDALQGLPQVDSVAIGSDIPYGGQGIFLPFATEGSSPTRAGERRNVRAEAVSPAYFDTLRIRLRAGRNFNSSDRPESPLVAVVSQGLANRYWPNQDPLGRRVRLDPLPAGRWITIVGVAAEVGFDWLDEPSMPVLYLSSSQFPHRANFVMLRSSRAAQMIAAVRERIRSVDPRLAVLDAKTWDAVIAESMIGLSYVSVIMTILGAIAVVLASFGLFGLMSYAVRSQRNELGLRLALGATPSIILRMVLGRALLLTGCGIAIGTGAAFLMSRLLSNLIFGVSSLDLTAYVLPAAALLSAGLTSAYFPAHQALRTESVRG